MPYGSTSDLPPAVKSNYSPECQAVFVRVFNKTVYNGGSEEQGFQNAHAAAKNCQGSKE